MGRDYGQNCAGVYWPPLRAPSLDAVEANREDLARDGGSDLDIHGHEAARAADREERRHGV